jgi:ribosomal protein L11 methyltransferase
MKRSLLWKVSVTTAPEAEDAVTDMLEGAFGQPASSYLGAATGIVVVSVYVPNRPAWSQILQKELALGLRRIASSGLSLGPGRISLKSIRKQDWSESWKLHFKPLAIGSTLLLKPSWSRRRPRKGQVEVVLDPGLSFGTGRHPTTAFCLRQLVALRRSEKSQSCLDIGTGSGILAIAAARLGYAPVDAFDFDPQAVRIARANARRNGVASSIRFWRQDLATLPRRSAQQYSLVCANLISSLLMAERERILARLGADGVLVIAGILEREFVQVQQCFEAVGLRLMAARTQNEWRCGAFCRR